MWFLALILFVFVTVPTGGEKILRTLIYQRFTTPIILFYKVDWAIFIFCIHLAVK